MSIKRVIITAGGTGGHLYPAQALAQQLQSADVEVRFVAGGLGTNRYFDQKSFSFQEIVCGPLLSRNPLKFFKGATHLFRGLKQSIVILKKYHPEVVVGFGSYYTAPILLAARWLKIPIVLHEANSVPGRANKLFAPFATLIGLNFPSAAAHFKGRTVEVGIPLREGYRLKAVSKEEACSYYGLSPHHPILLICGGSQGARAINELIKGCLEVFQRLSLQVVHLTGDLKMAEQLSLLYASYRIPCCVKAFETQMQMAWRAADGFLGRSGASTIAESLEFEVPGILIPYPFATDRHQEKNADFLVDTVGSAWKRLEHELTPEQLGETLEAFYNEKQMQILKTALDAYKQRPHQMTLCQLILNMETPKKIYVG